MSFNINRIKNFDVEEYIKNLWNKIDDIDKKVFLVSFTLMNIVYLYNSIYCLLGNWAIFAMFDKIPISVEIFCGRFSTSLIEYFLSNKTIIPMYINIILFLFLSVSVVILSNLFKIEKTLFSCLLVAFFLLLSPSMYSMLYFQTEAFGHLMTIFFIVILFFMWQKIDFINYKIKSYIYFFIILFVLSIFVLGAYQPAIATICGFLISKIFMDCLENDFHNIKEIIFNYKYMYILIFLSCVIYLSIYNFLLNSGLISSNSPNVQLFDFSDLHKHIFTFLYKTLNEFCFSLHPYVDTFYRNCSNSLVIISIFSVFCYLKKRGCLTVKKVIFVILWYLFIFYAFNIIYLLSPVLLSDQRVLRIEFYTSIPFLFVCVVICLRYASSFIKNFLLLILVIIFFLNVQIDFTIQKDQMIGQKVELFRINTLKNLIVNSPFYNHNKKKIYEYVEIGNYENIGEIETLIENIEYSPLENMTKTFLSQDSLFYALVSVPPKFKVSPNSVDKILAAENIEKHMSNNVKNWLLNDARVYPSLNSVYVEDKKIFLLLDCDIHTKIIENYKKYENKEF